MALLRDAFRGFGLQPAPLVLAGAATIAVYTAFRLTAQASMESGSVASSIAIDLAGLVTAGVVALPWYARALSAARGERSSTSTLLRGSGSLQGQAVASIWFWAAFLLGLRYLWGLPSILALVFYAFHGFTIADGKTKSGLKALGISARMSEGRRFVLFGIAVAFLLFNMAGALPLALGSNPVAVVASLLTLTVTASITLVAGANLYLMWREP